MFSHINVDACKTPGCKIWGFWGAQTIYRKGKMFSVERAVFCSPLSQPDRLIFSPGGESTLERSGEVLSALWRDVAEKIWIFH